MGNEPVLSGDDIIGVTTSGGYGHTVDKSLAFAYVSSGYESAGTTFDVRILGERRKAIVLVQAAWDPANARLKS
jgi:dimethylglycine dehydrogenase